MSYFTTLSQLPTALDAFGRLKTSNPTSIFDSKLIYNKAPLLWDEQIAGVGTASVYVPNNASVSISVSNLSIGSVVRQSKRRFLYQAGKSQLFALTGVLGAPTAGITGRIGAFDSFNGVFFQSGPGVSAGVGIRTFSSGAPVDTIIPQSSWNVDPMDGTGPSGLTVDFSKAQIFTFDLQWLGVGSVRFGLFINGIFYIVHSQPHSNLVTTVYMSTPNVPLRYEISNDGTGPAASLLEICSSVISEGGQEFTGQSHGVTRGATPLVTLNDSDLYPLLAIRQAPGTDSTIRPSSVSAVSTTNTNIEVQILLNPTIVGTTLNFSAVPNSVVQADVGTTNASKVTPGTGTLLFSAFVAAQSSIQIPEPIDFQPGFLIDGTSDIIVIAVRRLTGNAETIYGSLNWREAT